MFSKVLEYKDFCLREERTIILKSGVWKIDMVMKRKDSNYVEILSGHGEAATASNLIEYTIPVDKSHILDVIPLIQAKLH